jgi:hypothetical protein
MDEALPATVEKVRQMVRRELNALGVDLETIQESGTLGVPIKARRLGRRNDPALRRKQVQRIRYLSAVLLDIYVANEKSAEAWVNARRNSLQREKWEEWGTTQSLLGVLIMKFYALQEERQKRRKGALATNASSMARVEKFMATSAEVAILFRQKKRRNPSIKELYHATTEQLVKSERIDENVFRLHYSLCH